MLTVLLLMRMQETDTSDENIKDLVGEVANTISGNARRDFGKNFVISVPVIIAHDVDKVTAAAQPLLCDPHQLAHAFGQAGGSVWNSAGLHPSGAGEPTSAIPATSTIRKNRPRRGPNCGAPTPTPVPLRIWYSLSKILMTSKRAVRVPAPGIWNRWVSPVFTWV